MPTDAQRAAILNEALNATFPSRRIAASLLLDVLRDRSNDVALTRLLEIVEATKASEVVTELRKLIEEYGLR
jgi:hypothetical protein